MLLVELNFGPPISDRITVAPFLGSIDKTKYPYIFLLKSVNL